MTQPQGIGGSAAADHDADESRLQRLSFLASALAARPIDVTYAANGRARTDGRSIFVAAEADWKTSRKQVLVHAALLAGGMTAEQLRPLRRRREGLQRYFLLQILCAAAAPTVEGAIIQRGVDDLPTGVLPPHGPADVMRRALSVEDLPAAPACWGTIDVRLLRSAGAVADPAAGRPAASALSDMLDEDQGQCLELDDGGSEPDGLFDSPTGSGFLRRLFQNVAGVQRARTTDSPEGAESSAGSAMRGRLTGAVRPATSWRGGRGRAADPPGLSRLQYPEWDHVSQTFKADWCHVVATSATDCPVISGGEVAGGITAATLVPRLLRALSTVGMRSIPVGRLSDGPELDIDAAIDAIVDPGADQDAVYSRALPRYRDLAILVLLDASASTKDPSSAGGMVFSLQAQLAWAVIAATTRLGCRTSAMAFQGMGRKSVKLSSLKDFDSVREAQFLRRIAEVEPGGYTRTGAAVRHGTHVLSTRSGASRALLVVITDGLPYDIGYTDDYARADTAHALAEARASGIGCVCLSVGSDNPNAELARVFGGSTTAILPDSSELPAMARRLFIDALKGADLRRRLAH